MDDEGTFKVFKAFDDFLDRMPAWLFHSLGALTALMSLWFALVLMGGLPRSIVEWIVLAMFGAFAYAVGFMIPLIVAYLVDTASRLSVLLAFTGGAALVSYAALQGAL
ncbi:hypothetical protein N8I71_14215 [Roseibacterium sp. SDUM158016]|jgi:hypothetical protein|uniref:hypothetical protein n=1 Tax=Roseicyclus sediminis TaxID=2980997 RepID=UPI0021D3A962|nr:hypothetical protein [Roseibacterium sp. SDUM158016]MCU4653996.1 hypothetical protein [Roseibacterium sp. SDUM158016]